MIVTLELRPEELDALHHRAAEGTDVEAVLHGLIAALLPRPVLERPEEDPEERAERDRERGSYGPTSTDGARSRGGPRWGEGQEGGRAVKTGEPLLGGDGRDAGADRLV